MRYRFKIPTKHNVWHVFLEYFNNEKRLSFYTCPKDPFDCLLYHQPLESVSKTIWKRAKCFLLHPERFAL